MFSFKRQKHEVTVGADKFFVRALTRDECKEIDGREDKGFATLVRALVDQNGEPVLRETVKTVVDGVETVAVLGDEVAFQGVPLDIVHQLIAAVWEKSGPKKS